MGLHETKKLHNKINGHQIEEAAHKIGENICQLYILQGLIMKIWWRYYALMYENGKMRPVETSLRMVGQRIMIEVVNLTKIHCKNFCKCHNVPSAQQ
jgi:hypothetical protein